MWADVGLRNQTVRYSFVGTVRPQGKSALLFLGGGKSRRFRWRKINGELHLNLFEPRLLLLIRTHEDPDPQRCFLPVSHHHQPWPAPIITYIPGPSSSSPPTRSSLQCLEYALGNRTQPAGNRLLFPPPLDPFAYFFSLGSSGWMKIF